MLTKNTLLKLSNIYLENPCKHSYFSEMDKLQESATENEKRDLELIIKLQHLHLKSEDAENPYGPLAEYSNGITTFQIYDISDDDIVILRSLELDRLPIQLKARISDILWLLKKDHKMARHAFFSYLSLGKQFISDTKTTFRGIEFLQRAMYISQKLGRKEPLRRTWFVETEQILRHISINNKTWVPNKLIQLLLLPINKEYCLNANKEVYLNILNIQIEHWYNSLDNLEFLKHSFDTIKLIIRGQNEKIKECDLRQAEIYIKYVHSFNDNNPNDIFKSIDLLKSTRLIYEKYSMMDKVREVADKISQLQKKSLDFMIPFSASVDLSYLVNEFTPLLEDLSKEEKLDFLEIMTPFYDKQRTIQMVKDKRENSLLGDLFSDALINDKGEVEFQFPPFSDDIDVINVYAYRGATQYALPLYACYLSILIGYLGKHKWIEDNFKFLFTDNWLIPNNVEDSLQKGFSLGINGNINEAAPYFLSSIESIIRNFVDVCGGIVTRLCDDGTVELKTLGSLLKDNTFLDKCDEDIVFTLNAFFNSKAGSNLKNNFSHGRNNWQNNYDANTYLLCLMLKLCYIGSIEGFMRMNKMKSNPKFLIANEKWSNSAKILSN